MANTTRTFTQHITRDYDISLARLQHVRSVLIVNKGDDVANIIFEGDPYPLAPGNPVGESLRLGVEEVEPFRSDNIQVRFDTTNNPNLYILYNYTHY